MKKPVILILTLLAAIPLIAEEKLAGGPFVVNVGQKSATLAWVVETG